MIDLREYSDLFGKRIKVRCISGNVVVGKWIDWTSAMDNEPDPESMTVLNDYGLQIEIFINRIISIEEDDGSF